MTGKKRGRPATGRDENLIYLGYEIHEAYIGCREQGMSHDESLIELSNREWGVPGNIDLKYYGIESIKRAINESRDLGITDDDFKYSVRLQKTDKNEWLQYVYEIDPDTGEVKPKRS